MTHLYYIVVQYTSWLWRTTESGVVELDFPLNTPKGVDRCIEWLRTTKGFKDALLVWWTELEGDTGE